MYTVCVYTLHRSQIYHTALTVHCNVATPSTVLQSWHFLLNPFLRQVVVSRHAPSETFSELSTSNRGWYLHTGRRRQAAVPWALPPGESRCLKDLAVCAGNRVGMGGEVCTHKRTVETDNCPPVNLSLLPAIPHAPQQE